MKSRRIWERRWQIQICSKNSEEKIGKTPYLLVPSIKLFDVFVSVGNLLPLRVQEPVEDKLWRGSSHGWIVAVEKGPKIHLINPLTRIQKQLPPITTFPAVIEYRSHCVGHEYVLETTTTDENSQPCILSSEHIRKYFIQKVVLSSSCGYVAMAIYGHDSSKLAICRPEEEGWIDIGGVEQETNYTYIIFYRDNFYDVATDRKKKNAIREDIALLFQMLQTLWTFRLSNLRIHLNFNNNLCLRLAETCARVGAIDFGKRVLWEHNVYGLTPTVGSVNYLLLYAKEHNDTKLMVDIMKLLQRNHCVLQPSTVDIVFSICYNTDNWGLLSKYAKKFSKAGVKLRRTTYGTWMQFAAKRGDLAGLGKIEKPTITIVLIVSILPIFFLFLALHLRSKPHNLLVG